MGEDRSFINKKSDQADSDIIGPMEMDKFTFMQQMEKDADERAKARREREQIAQNFRTYVRRMQSTIYCETKFLSNLLGDNPLTRGVTEVNL